MDRATLIAAMQATAAEKPIAVQVPKWGTVYVRQVTVAEVEEQTADTEKRDDKFRMARGACRVLCDANGKRLFDPNSDADVKLIAAQPWPLLRRVLSASDGETDPGNG